MSTAGAPLTMFRMTTRNLYRRPMRTALTAVGVAVGVVAIVAFTTIVRGLWRSVEGIIHVNDAELLVFQSNIAADLLSILDEEETREKLRSVPGVERALGSLWHVAPVGNRPFCLILGLDHAEIDAESGNLIRGRTPAADDEVLLGSIASKHVLQRDVGDTVEIMGEACRVVGIYRTGVVFTDGGLVIQLRRLQRMIAKENQVTVFQVHLREGFDAEEIAEEIDKRYPELVAVSSAGEYQKADQGLVVANGMVWAVSFLAIVIGSIIVANTMWMTVLERTREIGVLRALGWARSRIVAMIIMEAAGVGVIAALIGCPAGFGLAKLAAVLPVSDQFLSPVFDAEPFLLALSISIGLSVLGALIPAWRAARISPAEALRYE